MIKIVKIRVKAVFGLMIYKMLEDAKKAKKPITFIYFFLIGLKPRKSFKNHYVINVSKSVFIVSMICHNKLSVIFVAPQHIFEMIFLSKFSSVFAD